MKLEHLPRDTKNNRKGFQRSMRQKRKVKEGILLLMNTTGKLVTTDKDSEVLNNIFASVFTGNLSPHTSGVDGTQDWGSKIPLTIKDQVHNHFRNRIILKSMGADGIDPRVLREAD